MMLGASVSTGQAASDRQSFALVRARVRQDGGEKLIYFVRLAGAKAFAGLKVSRILLQNMDSAFSPWSIPGLCAVQGAASASMWLVWPLTFLRPSLVFRCNWAVSLEAKPSYR